VVKRSTPTEQMYYWKPGETFNDITTLAELRKRQKMADMFVQVKKWTNFYCYVIFLCVIILYL